MSKRRLYIRDLYPFSLPTRRNGCENGAPSTHVVKTARCGQKAGEMATCSSSRTDHNINSVQQCIAFCRLSLSSWTVTKLASDCRQQDRPECPPYIFHSLQVFSAMAPGAKAPGLSGKATAPGPAPPPPKAPVQRVPQVKPEGGSIKDLPDEVVAGWLQKGVTSEIMDKAIGLSDCILQ